MTTRAPTPRLGWALTGSGHYVQETLDLMKRMPKLDIFLSKAGDEVLRQYGKDLSGMQEGTRVFKDGAASAPPVGNFYKGHYHTLIVGPATSNTVAKCVVGISDTLPTNCFAQAGKCRVPTIVFACDTRPEMDTEAPSGWFKVYPRRVDLENTERLREFDATTVVETLSELEEAVLARMAHIGETVS
ncbi:archaeoflavoprotein, family [Hartmannibacter diazotrophicus]|uniref:Archaeoflavoprotein, family n=1 Tax=Hartmannibacter diazotrophicus TaxID=1482074 RepID=A0A2C9D6A1_9HYPH|nr:flavoprotein [Hartmannibacter diazotrophicus]SON55837.1 archaeoflavoprotein, family [Hartmannibacter diazotrophicus]